MNTQVAENVKSILILDDEENTLEILQKLIKEKIFTHITATKYPSEAAKLAKKYFFDVILIDVTVQYNGNPFGGIELYRDLFPRYGDSSLLAYSQYINDQLLKQYEFDFNFIEKGTNFIGFGKAIVKKIISLRKRQTCFIAMPFDKKHSELFIVIKKCIEEAFYRPLRVDEQYFTKSITEKIFEEIKSSKLVIFLTTDKNPNAYYECGYSVALGKEVITVTDYYKNLPFDIRDRNAISYGKSISKLRSNLNKRLLYLTAIKP